MYPPLSLFHGFFLAPSGFFATHLHTAAVENAAAVHEVAGDIDNDEEDDEDDDDNADDGAGAESGVLEGCLRVILACGRSPCYRHTVSLLS